MTDLRAASVRLEKAGAPTPLLEVESLSVDFATDRGWARVVDDVSLTVAPGEVVGLVGESGSGKSVTALSILGLIPSPPGRVAEGAIRFDGRDLLGLGQRELSAVRGEEIAMIFQEPMTSLDPAFTVGEQIAETVRRHKRVSRKAAWARAVEVLDTVGIPSARVRARDYPHTFSGGQRQRVMIALALSCDPRLIVADEPTTALDVTVQADLLQLLRDLQADLGTALIFITHDLGVVAELCQRVMVMYAGQVVEEAAALPLFEEPQHPYTAGLLRSMPQNAVVGDDLWSIRGVVPPPWDHPDGCLFHPRCEHARPGTCDAERVSLVSLGSRRARCARVDELDLEGMT